MSRPNLGRGACVGIGKETTWGTTASATVWMGLVSETMSRNLEKKPRPTLAEASGSANRRGHYTGLDNVGGSVTVELTYEGFGLLMEHMLGGTASTTGPSGGLYTHTIALSATPQVGLSVYVNKGQGSTEIFSGCKISKATLKAVAGQVVVVTLELIAKTSDSRASTTSPAWTTSRDLIAKHNQAGLVGWNSTTESCRSVELTIDNKVVRRNNLGSPNTLEPVTGDFVEITMKAEVEYFSDAKYVAWLADTQGDLTFTLSGPTSYAIAITLQNAYLNSYADPVSAPGVIMQQVEWTGESDGTDEGLKVVITNSQATA